MAEMKKYDQGSDKTNLKKADSKKTRGDGALPQAPSADLFEGKRIRDTVVKKTRGKKLPIAVDIIIGIILVAMVIAVIVGAYMLFRYFSNDYDVSEVEYTVISQVSGDLESYASLEDKSVYYNVWGNSLYFGKVKDVSMIVTPSDDDKDTLVITISAEVKHRDGEGYKIEDCWIAIGSEYDLMIGDMNVSKAAIVEVNEKGGN